MFLKSMGKENQSEKFAKVLNEQAHQVKTSE